MKIILTIVFLFTSVAFQNAAMAGCDTFNLVEAQKISDIIAKNKDLILDAKGKKVAVNSVCMNTTKKANQWTVAVNCNSGSCQAIDAGTFRVQSAYGQPNFHLAELAVVQPVGCKLTKTPVDDGQEASGVEAHP